jgi:hypothetical protein
LTLALQLVALGLVAVGRAPLVLPLALPLASPPLPLALVLEPGLERHGRTGGAAGLR